MHILDRAPPSALLLVACAFWGAGTVLNKALLASLPPVTLLFLLLAPSAAALWTATLLSHVRFPKSSLLAPIVLLGLLNPGVVYTLTLIGLSRVSASVTTLLWASEPLMILILAAVLLREPVSGRLLAVLALGVVGVAFVAGLAEGLHGAGSEPVGVLLLVLAVLCCATYTVISRGLSGSADPLSIVTIQQTAGLGWSLAFLSAGTRYGGWTDIANIGLPQLATAALSGLMYYAAAYWLYLAALRVVPAGVAGAYFNAIPVFGVGLAIVFLGETLTRRSMGRRRCDPDVRDRACSPDPASRQAHSLIGAGERSDAHGQRRPRLAERRRHLMQLNPSRSVVYRNILPKRLAITWRGRPFKPSPRKSGETEKPSLCCPPTPSSSGSRAG